MGRPPHDSLRYGPHVFTGYTGVQVPTSGSYFHLHLVSDSTGETLITVARAAAAQHTLNAEYFKRIDALNYTLMHDDGQHVEGLEEADVVLVGVSRTSKTPTSIYLANRGIRTANVPLVPGIAIPHQLETLTKPLVVSLHATPERLIQVRQNRLLSMGDRDNDTYIDRQAVTDEVAFARRLSAKFNWAQLDVTRRSIEETAAAILKLFTDRQRQQLAE